MAPPKSTPPLIDLTVDIKEEPKEKRIKQESSSTSSRSGRKVKEEMKIMETLVKLKTPKNEKKKPAPKVKTATISYHQNPRISPNLGSNGFSRVESLRPQYSLSDVKSEGNLTKTETKIANLQYRLQKSNNEGYVKVQGLTNEITKLNEQYSTDISRNLQTIHELQLVISEKDKLLEQSQSVSNQQNKSNFEIETLKSMNALLRKEMQQKVKELDDLKDKRVKELIQMDKLKKDLKELKEKYEGDAPDTTNPQDSDEIIEIHFVKRAPKRESSGDGDSILSSEIPPKIQKISNSEVKNECPLD